MNRGIKVLFLALHEHEYKIKASYVMDPRNRNKDQRRVWSKITVERRSKDEQ